MNESVLTTTTSATDAEEPPQHLLSDFVELAYLLFLVLVGTPINLRVLLKLLAEKRKTTPYSVRNGFILLKINLNISDLLILTVFIPGKIGWIITYQWRGGDGMCRVFNFVSMFCLYLSSNIVVCIALDRLRTVLGASQQHTKDKSRIIRIILTIAWLFSAICSLPQAYVWRTLNISPHGPSEWIQCTDIWTIGRHADLLPDAPSIPALWYHQGFENAYGLSHLFFVFYGPLVILAIAYVVIAVKLFQYSVAHPQTFTTKRRRTTSTDGNNDEHLLMGSLSQADPATIVSLASHVDYATDNTKKLSVESPKSWRSALSLVSQQRVCVALSPRKEKTARSCKELAAQARLPTWRRQLRSHVFRTTLLVILAHVLLWLPYNLYALMRYVNVEWYEQLNEHVNVLKDLQFLITIINPFLYGFAK